MSSQNWTETTLRDEYYYVYTVTRPEHTFVEELLFALLVLCIVLPITILYCRAIRALQSALLRFLRPHLPEALAPPAAHQ